MPIRSPNYYNDFIRVFKTYFFFSTVKYPGRDEVIFAVRILQQVLEKPLMRYGLFLVSKDYSTILKKMKVF